MSEVNDVRAALERLGQLPTPDVDIASYKQCCEEMGRFVTLGHKPALSMIARIENDAKTIEALAGTGFTSGCADGHPEIRYQGAECPLCEALRVLAEAREMVAMLDDYPIGSAAVKGMYATLNHIDAIRSRPSSDQDGETK